MLPSGFFKSFEAFEAQGVLLLEVEDRLSQFSAPAVSRGRPQLKGTLAKVCQADHCKLLVTAS